jgi:hypothetical protein
LRDAGVAVVARACVDPSLHRAGTRLDDAAGMRTALVVVVAACAPPPTTATHDAAPLQPACYDGILSLGSPLANEHYSTDFIAVGTLTGPDTMVQAELIDDAGTPYAFTGFTLSPPDALDRYAGTWRWQLAPSRRYELTMWNCCDAICATKQDPIRVAFFTSP